MPAYNYACALTGYMPDTLSSSMIDAAHIHSFANSRNNNPHFTINSEEGREVALVLARHASLE
ncbi:MAG: hypothetical protein HN757_10465 [Calditrichaeota bacterium]|nr:hypothetical protein [Calditrichota bacterium]